MKSLEPMAMEWNRNWNCLNQKKKYYRYSLTKTNTFAMQTCRNYVLTDKSTRHVRWLCLQSMMIMRTTSLNWNQMAQYLLTKTMIKYWAQIKRWSQYYLSRKMTRINLYSKTIKRLSLMDTRLSLIKKLSSLQHGMVTLKKSKNRLRMVLIKNWRDINIKAQLSTRQLETDSQTLCDSYSHSNPNLILKVKMMVGVTRLYIRLPFLCKQNVLAYSWRPEQILILSSKGKITNSQVKQ